MAVRRTMITKRNSPPPPVRLGSSGQMGRSGIYRHSGMITSGETVRPTPKLQRPNILTPKPSLKPAPKPKPVTITSSSTARAPQIPRGTPASARSVARPYIFPGTTPQSVPVPKPVPAPKPAPAPIRKATPVSPKPVNRPITPSVGLRRMKT